MDGGHVWLSRATDPSAEEVQRAEDGLIKQGLSGWIAVSEGVYFSSDRMTLIKVRPLGTPAVPFSDAVAAFHALRAASLDDTAQ